MVELLGLEAHARFRAELPMELLGVVERLLNWGDFKEPSRLCTSCLLYTSDAADE